jgi:hypothetical protein
MRGSPEVAVTRNHVAVNGAGLYRVSAGGAV